MSDLQEVFARVKRTKKEQRDLKAVYRDALSTSKEYQDLLEEYKNIKTRKKQIEEDTKSQFRSEFDKLDGLKEEIKSDCELLSDLALSKLMKGETVEIRDENETQYEPVFSVKFKKVS